MSPLRAYRYAILADGHLGPDSSKTANSALRYLPERVMAVVDARHAGRTTEEVVGLGGATPVVGTLAEALAHGPDALLVGIAPQGGRLPEAWRARLREAVEAGLHLVAGLHVFLADDAELAEAARRRGVRIHDLRRPPDDLPVSTGRARLLPAFRVLTVGTDCNLGKMTAALQLRDALERRGTRAAFAATGQTGILIEGRGIAVDAVVADFVAGAAERLVEEAAEGADVVLVEGQGSLTHPGYSAVTLGLLHGSMPDAMVLCHRPGRTFPYGGGGAYRWAELPSLSEAVRTYEAMAAPLHPARVVGISLHTGGMPDAEAREEVARAEAATGLPAVDPVRDDPAPLVEAILAARDARRAERGMEAVEA